MNLFDFFFFFLFSFFSFFYFFHKNGVTPLYVAVQEGHEQIVQILLEKGKPNVDLATMVNYFSVYLLLCYYYFSLSFSFSFFTFSFFQIFCCLKMGATPLFIAVQNGHEKIVQILLEKGNPNVDLADQVLLLF